MPNRCWPRFKQNKPSPAAPVEEKSAQGSLLEPLSERELEVLALIAGGLSNREICARLHISLSTVKGHAANIYGKLGVNSRTRAISEAVRLGLLDRRSSPNPYHNHTFSRSQPYRLFAMLFMVNGECIWQIL